MRGALKSMWRKKEEKEYSWSRKFLDDANRRLLKTSRQSWFDDVNRKMLEIELQKELMKCGCKPDCGCKE